MEPLSALAIASAVSQIVDFSSKVIARTREVYISADGAIEENRLLKDATANLDDLMERLQTSTYSRNFGYDFSHGKSPDQQLLQLAEDSHSVAISLREMLDK